MFSSHAAYFIFHHNPCLLVYFIAALAETNRIPSDLPEPEPESVAGCITEYSSIYYSIIVLTEYTNIIALIPALLHPSTMVIAGVYLGVIIDDQLVLLLDISCFFSLAYSISLSITLIFSLWSAISVSDVKSIIASPTISQISYMFLALVIHPILSLLIYYFMLYVRACYLFYLEHLFILNYINKQFIE